MEVVSEWMVNGRVKEIGREGGRECCQVGDWVGITQERGRSARDCLLPLKKTISRGKKFRGPKIKTV